MNFENLKITRGDSPVIAAAIHCGHHVRKEVRDELFITEKGRLTEEDPFTDTFIDFAPSQVITNISRFEFDVNRPPEKSVYINPEDAWGLKIWRGNPSPEIIERSRLGYSEFYSAMKVLIGEYVKRFGKIFVYDVHSYNYKIRSSNSDADTAEKNPDINIGTGNIDNDYWKDLTADFINDLRAFDFAGGQLDVRKNVKFRGGYYSKWINENFGNSVCVLSVEVKKIFMDELNGELYPDKAALIKSALHSTMPGVLNNLRNVKFKSG